MRSDYRAVIFDLWDTLVPYPAGAADEAIGALAGILSVDKEALASSLTVGTPLMFGDFTYALREVCVRHGFDQSAERLAEAASDWSRRHRDLLVPRPETLPTLDELRRRGVRLGLISNCSSDLVEAWESSSLASRFDVVVLSCLVGVVKPDARIYQRALDQLGLTAATCLYVGDTVSELVGASAAGMRSLQLGHKTNVDLGPWLGEHIATVTDVLGYVGEAAEGTA